MSIYVDVDNTPLRLQIQLYLSERFPTLQFTDSAHSANLVIGPSHKLYTTPSIKFTDTASTIAEDDYCVGLVPFPDSTEALEYLFLEVGKCL